MPIDLPVTRQARRTGLTVRSLRKVKDAGKALDGKVAARYKQLAPVDIQQLVVRDKWLAALRTRVDGELDRVSRRWQGA